VKGELRSLGIPVRIRSLNTKLLSVFSLFSVFGINIERRLARAVIEENLAELSRIWRNLHCEATAWHRGKTFQDLAFHSDWLFILFSSNMI
jgi:hypothetical protein